MWVELGCASEAWGLGPVACVKSATVSKRSDLQVLRGLWVWPSSMDRKHLSA